MLASCGPQARIRKAVRVFSADSSLAGAHIGLSFYDAGKHRFIYNRDADNYFVPASNLKILTCYLALKYLGDSIPGIEYAIRDSAVFLFPTGDPSFLHPDFKSQPVAAFIRQQNKPVYLVNDRWHTDAFGSGWQWDDYNEAYSAERSAFPVYGNCIRWIQEHSGNTEMDSALFDQSVFIYSIPEVDMPVRFDPAPNARAFKVTRDLHENAFLVRQGADSFARQDVPFITHGSITGLQLIEDSIGKQVNIKTNAEGIFPDHLIYSRPVDSLLIPMMHHSDNFFAEQLLLMVSRKLTGSFDESRLIDSLLKTELQAIPGKPRWVDGSGLSRYNLFTPRQIVTVLQKMQEEFPEERLESIFPELAHSGVTGTHPRVIAKTGTMSGVVALSGYVLTASGKRLIFSILVNNHRGSATAIRHQIAKLLNAID